MYTVIYADPTTRTILCVECANFATAQQVKKAHQGARIVEGHLFVKGH